MNTTVWGIPTASYPSTACNFSYYFPPQNLVLVTTLCGAWYESHEPKVTIATHTRTGQVITQLTLPPAMVHVYAALFPHVAHILILHIDAGRK